MKKSLLMAIGRRNRLPYHGTSSVYRRVGQAVPPVSRLFHQPREAGDWLDEVQNGRKPDDSKPVNTPGTGRSGDSDSG